MWNACTSVTKHSRIGTARMKYDGETDEEDKKRGVSVERSKAGTARFTGRPITS